MQSLLMLPILIDDPSSRFWFNSASLAFFSCSCKLWIEYIILQPIWNTKTSYQYLNVCGDLIWNICFESPVWQLLPCLVYLILGSLQARYLLGAIEREAFICVAQKLDFRAKPVNIGILIVGIHFFIKNRSRGTNSLLRLGVWNPLDTLEFRISRTISMVVPFMVDADFGKRVVIKDFRVLGNCDATIFIVEKLFN